MATLTLRPSSDVTVTNWSATTGTAYYAMVNEAVADDATTQLTASSVVSPASARFGLPALALPSGTKATAARLVVRWYSAIAGGGSAGLSVALTGNGTYTKTATDNPTAYTTQQYDLPAKIIDEINAGQASFSIDLIATVTGSSTVDKLTTYTQLFVTQVYVEIDYVPQKPTGLHKSWETNSSVTMAWDSVIGAASYNIYKDGVLLANTASNSYAVSLAFSDNASHTYGVQTKNAAGETSDIIVLVTQKIPTAEVSAISISEVSISPNPTNINAPLAVFVAASETVGYVDAQIIYTAEFSAGEI